MNLRLIRRHTFYLGLLVWSILLLFILSSGLSTYLISLNVTSEIVKFIDTSEENETEKEGNKTEIDTEIKVALVLYASLLAPDNAFNLVIIDQEFQCSHSIEIPTPPPKNFG